ncbi:hypothetical protein COCSADRAFT_210071 [Bipolaris sorokiniana ND90Pr]|uniref:Uncharacterized protein n=1 Tax=Cochliobolus sativus (strain ND90Pr / ATCC 201652) TaxID=665912 RepID=M2RS79_COCSN|nr:uncharacterized protein COCSADRAFT_210071 [Bipolaris sorokiniana ND90Pr]EMD69439.1 hypothetical protein COCSADRAFT_210071 [Bipolaris sorokiniana ND90Pr]
MDTRIDSLNTSNLDYAKYLNDSKSSKHSSSHKANLSGATMLDLLSGTEGSIAAAYQTSHSKPQPSRSKRPSDVSSSKNELRQTNRMLVEIVQNAQLELATQRQTMLDMQSRILQLEHVLYKSNSSAPESCASTTITTATTQRVTSQPKPVEEKILVNPAAQHQASSLSVTPTSKPEFWKSPSRFSGFNFNFDLLETVPRSSKLSQHSQSQKQQQKHQRQQKTPSEASEVYKSSRPPAPPSKSPRNTTQQALKHRTLTKKSSEATLLTRPTLPHDAVGSDIKEHIVEYEHVKIPFPPLLHSPPKTARSRLAPTVQSRDDELTALPQMPEQVQPVQEQHVVGKGRRAIKNIRISRPFSRSFRIDCANGVERRASHFGML